MKPALRVTGDQGDAWLSVYDAIRNSPIPDIVNLSQGFFGYNPPEFITNALKDTIDSGRFNQYAASKGGARLRHALAKSYSPHWGRVIDPETEVLVTTGANEGILSVIMAYVEPGDEVIVIEPHFFQFISLKAPEYATSETTSSADWTLDMNELENIINAKTKILILNTPHNPTGKIFSQSEIQDIGTLCSKNSILLLSDEVYFHYTFSTPSLPATLFPKTTLTIGSCGKDFAATGYRVGFVLGSKELLLPVAKAHSAICFAAPNAAQEAMAVGYEVADRVGFWMENRELVGGKMVGFNEVWERLGVPYVVPQGGYLVIVNLAKVRIPESVVFPESIEKGDVNGKLSWFLINEIGVAAIPPACFYSTGNPALRESWFRFAVCREDATLNLAKERLLGLKKYIVE